MKSYEALCRILHLCVSFLSHASTKVKGLEVLLLRRRRRKKENKRRIFCLANTRRANDRYLYALEMLGQHKGWNLFNSLCFCFKKNVVVPTQKKRVCFLCKQKNATSTHSSLNFHKGFVLALL